MHQTVRGLTPAQGVYGRQPINVSLSLSLSLSLKSINTFLGKDFF